MKNMKNETETIISAITIGYQQIRDDYAKNPEKARKARRLFYVGIFIIIPIEAAVIWELIRRLIS